MGLSSAKPYHLRLGFVTCQTLPAEDWWVRHLPNPTSSGLWFVTCQTLPAEYCMGSSPAKPNKLGLGFVTCQTLPAQDWWVRHLPNLTSRGLMGSSPAKPDQLRLGFVTCQTLPAQDWDGFVTCQTLPAEDWWVCHLPNLTSSGLMGSSPAKPYQLRTDGFVTCQTLPAQDWWVRHLPNLTSSGLEFVTCQTLPAQDWWVCHLTDLTISWAWWLHVVPSRSFPVTNMFVFSVDFCHESDKPCGYFQVWQKKIQPTYAQISLFWALVFVKIKAFFLD